MSRARPLILVPLLGSKAGRDLFNEYLNHHMDFTSSSSKRTHDSDSDSDSNLTPEKITRIEPSNNSWPRFLLVSGTDEQNPLGKCNAVAISKTFYGCIGNEDFKVTRLGNGNLIVEVNHERHCRSLIRLKEINCCGVTYPVRVEPHHTLNTSKGVVRDNEFKLFKNDGEILEALAPEGVVQAQRIMFKKEGGSFPTGTVFLTFGTPDLPTKIKLGFLVVRVSPYIPNPMRCFKCQRYGHTSTRCKRTIVCSICAEDGHDDRSCAKRKKCANCDGDHPAFSKDCPIWRQEKEIQVVKTSQKMSYFEAKRIVLGASHPTTFAHVIAKRPTVTVGTQTTPDDSKCICTLEAYKKKQTTCLALTDDDTSPIQPSEAQTNVATSSVQFPLPSSAKSFDQCSGITPQHQEHYPSCTSVQSVSDRHASVTSVPRSSSPKRSSSLPPSSRGRSINRNSHNQRLKQTNR